MWDSSCFVFETKTTVEKTVYTYYSIFHALDWCDCYNVMYSWIVHAMDSILNDNSITSQQFLADIVFPH